MGGIEILDETDYFALLKQVSLTIVKDFTSTPAGRKALGRHHLFMYKVAIRRPSFPDRGKFMSPGLHLMRHVEGLLDCQYVLGTTGAGQKDERISWLSVVCIRTPTEQPPPTEVELLPRRILKSRRSSRKKFLG